MEIEYINELKNDVTEGLMIQNNKNLGYKIRIVYRGEGLFYHNLITNKAFICDIQIRDSIIFAKSIKRWDDKTLIANKEEILEHIKNYFLDYQKIVPKFI
ncbi:hypothetical protein NAT51_18545 [Flavobacterium amniphilum]|uniref:hypothetical protein n=1 Tax=Flavobacterium amniphilum TaxID=1834035 RepID=UPI00202A9D7E|nr:hypothetical protein [Flavobacterium amniphilum]MCL9807525.1 hypothetical protein [Flavobacterium amniphilum]MCL9807530.1 hypothetical protein [Flavobacterium amniphilum]